MLLPAPPEQLRAVLRASFENERRLHERHGYPCMRTPWSYVEAQTTVPLLDANNNGFVRVLDQGCGAGATLAEFVDKYERRGLKVEACGLCASLQSVDSRVWSFEEVCIDGESCYAARTGQGSTAIFRSQDIHDVARLGSFNVVYSVASYIYLPLPLLAAEQTSQLLTAGGVCTLLDIECGALPFTPSGVRLHYSEYEALLRERNPGWDIKFGPSKSAFLLFAARAGVDAFVPVLGAGVGERYGGKMVAVVDCNGEYTNLSVLQ